ncbi:ferrous iron transport protein B [Venenivibrio stagnispumantis]|uniref:Ferrous iron transport protein B n=1 Tax=Venenivibrio stagnispumantis TaxID=407998 RepID=A0AA45WL92_9AQUI|nr:ferrous iron transport protein B [Venenivibrio stagnispumantis]MCW4573347.1 ferrous iron transport protein B [Venenivibrio stagnispumantis]SMP10571.1 ferrous iron transport protein B [Venenivibrio stagnispumantis]
MDNIIRVAIAGNPNVGKTALLNAIAGTNLKVGNWAGVTVEKKEAVIDYKSYKIEFVDLPGVYSLSNKVAEEKIAIDFLIKEKPDIILNVVDSTNLERNLYLTIQLLELEIPLIIALNIWDEAVEKGYEIDYKKLEKLLCVKAIPTSAKENLGITEILDSIIQIYQNKNFIQCEHFETDIEEYLKKIIEVVEKYQPVLLSLYPKRYLAIALLENNLDIEINPNIKEFVAKIRKDLEKIYGKEIDIIIVEERYSIVISVYEQVVKKKREDKVDITFTLDKIFLHKYLGIPIFLFLLWLVFEITFTFSSPFVDWFDNVLSNVISVWAISLLDYVGASEFIKSFVTQAVIGGVGFVIAFVPVLFVLYILIAILEGTGYMARAAFLMDRFMSIVGLSGKSFIPLIIGFGCNVPAVYSTRTIESPKEKILTILMIPFMSCGARLTVYTFFVSLFFREYGSLVLLSLYLLGVFMAVIVAFILNKFMFKTYTETFILELPPYRFPTLKYIFLNTWIKTKSFILEAGTFIFATSIVVWFLLNTPFGEKNKENTIFGTISKTIAPVFEPMGFGNWQSAGALLSGFVAKEVVLSTMGNIYAPELAEQEENKKLSFTEGVKEIAVSFLDANIQLFKNILSTFKLIKPEEEKEENITLSSIVKNSFTPLSAYAFLVFLLLYTPCLATIFAIKQETDSFKWAFFSIFISLTTAWITSFIVYNIGKLMF